MEIRVTDEELCGYTEGKILGLLIAIYPHKYPGDDGKKSIAEHIGRSIPSIIQCCQDVAHLSVAEMLKIDELFQDEKFFSRWLAMQLGCSPEHCLRCVKTL